VVSAQAAKKKKATSVKFYFHGVEQIGELDSINNVGVGYNAMDTTEPSGAAPKSISWLTWTGDPALWNDCAGMFTLPVWLGKVSGRIVGDMKVMLHSVSGPATVDVQVWPDVTMQTCASNDVSQGKYPEPAAQTTVELTPGHGEAHIVLKDVDFKAIGSMIIQFRPHGPVPGRILYDTPDLASLLEFKCIPASGKRCTP
jgi:hypothetical protein